MSRYIAPIVLSLALFAPAHAQDAPPDADLRCLLVSFLGASNPDANFRSASILAAMYYLGRVDGRAPQMDLSAALVSRARTFHPEQAASEMKRCGAELKARAEALKELGAEFQAEAAKTRS
jgi:hypothetical protein